MKVNEVYASVITAGTHLAPSMKVAEAAKVIENSQRDINIAFVNELSKIFTEWELIRRRCWKQPVRNGISFLFVRVWWGAIVSA